MNSNSIDRDTHMGTNMGNNNSNVAMANNTTSNIDLLDLSADDAIGRPERKQMTSEPLPILEKASAASQMIRKPEGALVPPFFSSDLGKAGKVGSASPSAVQGVHKIPQKLNYFDDSSDEAPKRPFQSQVNSTSDHPTGEINTNSEIAIEGSKKRKASAGRLSHSNTSSLFMTPTPSTPPAQKAARVRPVAIDSTTSSRVSRTNTPAREMSKDSGFKVPRTPTYQAPSSFGAQARGVLNASSKPIAPRPQPQPPHSTGIVDVDITASLQYMMAQIQRTSADIVQPVIDLTMMVKKLELENANLRAQLHGFQESVKKSMSDIHERQNEHEDLIDRLGNPVISSSGSPYGGPRLAGVKEKSLFQGMLSGTGDA